MPDWLSATLLLGIVAIALAVWSYWRAAHPGLTGEGWACVHLYDNATTAAESLRIDQAYPPLPALAKRTQLLRCGALRLSGQLARHSR